jgi:hypothetical protein
LVGLLEGDNPSLKVTFRERVPLPLGVVARQVAKAKLSETKSQPTGSQPKEKDALSVDSCGTGAGDSVRSSDAGADGWNWTWRQKVKAGLV